MPKTSTDHLDLNEKKYYIQHTEDVAPLLDHLKEQRNHQDAFAYKMSPARWAKVAEVPLIILDKWFHEGFNALAKGNEKEVIRRLKQDYPHLLVRKV